MAIFYTNLCKHMQKTAAVLLSSSMLLQSCNMGLEDRNMENGTPVVNGRSKRKGPAVNDSLGLTNLGGGNTTVTEMSDNTGRSSMNDFDSDKINSKKGTSKLGMVGVGVGCFLLGAIPFGVGFGVSWGNATNSLNNANGQNTVLSSQNTDLLVRNAQLTTQLVDANIIIDSSLYPNGTSIVMSELSTLISDLGANVTVASNTNARLLAASDSSSLSLRNILNVNSINIPGTPITPYTANGAAILSAINTVLAGTTGSSGSTVHSSGRLLITEPTGNDIVDAVTSTLNLVDPAVIAANAANSVTYDTPGSTYGTSQAVLNAIIIALPNASTTDAGYMAGLAAQSKSQSTQATVVAAIINAVGHNAFSAIAAVAVQSITSSSFGTTYVCANAPSSVLDSTCSICSNSGFFSGSIPSCTSVPSYVMNCNPGACTNGGTYNAGSFSCSGGWPTWNFQSCQPYCNGGWLTGLTASTCTAGTAALNPTCNGCTYGGTFIGAQPTCTVIPSVQDPIGECTYSGVLTTNNNILLPSAISSAVSSAIGVSSVKALASSAVANMKPTIDIDSTVSSILKEINTAMYASGSNIVYTDWTQLGLLSTPTVAITTYSDAGLVTEVGINSIISSIVAKMGANSIPAMIASAMINSGTITASNGLIQNPSTAENVGTGVLNSDPIEILANQALNLLGANSTTVSNAVLTGLSMAPYSNYVVSTPTDLYKHGRLTNYFKYLAGLKSISITGRTLSYPSVLDLTNLTNLDSVTLNNCVVNNEIILPNDLSALSTTNSTLCYGGGLISSANGANLTNPGFINATVNSNAINFNSQIGTGPLCPGNIGSIPTTGFFPTVDSYRKLYDTCQSNLNGVTTMIGTLKNTTSQAVTGANNCLISNMNLTNYLNSYVGTLNTCINKLQPLASNPVSAQSAVANYCIGMA